MKKILILLAAIMLILSGCTKEYFKRRHQKQIDNFLAGSEHNPVLFGKWEYKRLDSNNKIRYVDTLNFKPDGILIREAYSIEDNLHRQYIEYWRTKGTYRLDLMEQRTPALHEGMKIKAYYFVIQRDTLAISGTEYGVPHLVSQGRIYLRVK